MTLQTDSRPIVSTWILIDDDRTSSFFPQAGRMPSSDPRVQRIYWRCVVVFFATAIKSNGAHCRYRLYTNSSADLSASGLETQAALREMKVEIVHLDFTFNPPDGYCDRFRNQFYIFDILGFIAAEADSRCDLVLDSDCLCLRPLEELFEATRQNGALTLTDGYQCGQDINGLTREQMQELFRDLGCDLASPPEYLCGELYCATSDVSRKIASHVKEVFAESIQRWTDRKLRFFEEAQLLTYFYYRLQIAPGSAGRFARRVWTGFQFHNGEEIDRNRHILHLPGEKRFGFKKLFHLVLSKASWFNGLPYGPKWIAKVNHTVGIPQPSKWKMFVEVLFYARARLLR
jgi:hypothetical protein